MYPMHSTLVENPTFQLKMNATNHMVALQIDTHIFSNRNLNLGEMYKIVEIEQTLDQ